MAQPTITLGRGVITGGNLLYAVGAFLADFNETHVYNPRWPPHARFHNGQTMSLGILLSTTSLYFAYRPFGTQLSTAATRDSIFYSALIGSFYCFAGLTAILYPGTVSKSMVVITWYCLLTFTPVAVRTGMIRISQSGARSRYYSLEWWRACGLDMLLNSIGWERRNKHESLVNHTASSYEICSALVESYRVIFVVFPPPSDSRACR